jgi:general secretion pathway protein I
MPTRLDPSRAAAGFTLIEAIVALVVLSTAVVAFYDFLSTALSGAAHIEAAATDYDRRMNALELASAINPMTMPQGDFNLGTYHIRWTSQPLGPVRQSTGYPAGPGFFKIALYQVTLSFPGQEGTAPVAATRVGFIWSGASAPTN